MVAKKIDLEVAAKMAERGDAVAKMAKTFGVTDSTMRSALRDAGIPFRDSRFKLTVNDDLFRADWIAGKRVCDIAREHGISETHASTYARKLGLPARDGQASRRKASDEDIKALYEQGLKPTEIARETGISAKTIYGRLDRIIGAKPKPKPAPKPAPSKSFPPLHARILRTKGRWSALAEIAAQEGLRMAQVQRIWHEVRVG